MAEVASNVKSIALTAFALSAIMCIIVLMCMPKTKYDGDGNTNPRVHFLKLFILAFCASFGVLYLTQDTDSNTMMTNIIKGEPDF